MYIEESFPCGGVIHIEADYIHTPETNEGITRNGRNMALVSCCYFLFQGTERFATMTLPERNGVPRHATSLSWYGSPPSSWALAWRTTEAVHT